MENTESLPKNTVNDNDKYRYIHPKVRANWGRGRPKGALNKRTRILNEKLPGLTEFLKNFDSNHQAQVKNYLGFRSLIEAAEMVDGGEETDRPFDRRLKIVDRTLPRSQEVNVTQKHALITGKLETLLKLYDQEPNDNKQLECIDVTEWKLTEC